MVVICFPGLSTTSLQEFSEPWCFSQRYSLQCEHYNIFVFWPLRNLKNYANFLCIDWLPLRNLRIDDALVQDFPLSVAYTAFSFCRTDQTILYLFFLYWVTRVRLSGFCNSANYVWT